MITNIQALKDKAKKYAQENNLTVQQILQDYMFERFLERLAKSKYNDKFIIKGGLLISSIIGINVRTTMDIDIDVTGIYFEKNIIEKIIKEILQIEINDNIEMNIEKIEDIREKNEYGGFKFKIIAKFGNLKIPFHIDISTGDIVTPKAIEYKYKTILDNSYINIWTYNKETIIAEKLQTILERKNYNSRMKDFYDLYYFVNFKWNEINKNILKQAVKVTFTKKKSLKDLANISEIIEVLENDKNLKLLWKDYKEKHNYAKNVTYNDIIQSINFIKNIITKNYIF